MLFRWLSRLFARPSTVRHFDYVLGLGDVLVPPHCTATLSARPGISFRPERLVIPRGVAEHLLVCDVTVGRERQLRSVGRVPATMFDDRSSGPCLRSCVARPCDYVSVTVYNTSDDNQLFQAGIYGPEA